MEKRVKMRTETSSVREIPELHLIGHTCANLNGDLLFVWGGTNEQVACVTNRNNNLWIYDTLTGYWRRRLCTGDCPPYLSGCSSCLIGKKMYLFGGYSTIKDNRVNSLYYLDLETFRWTDLSNAPGDPTKPICSDKSVCWSYGNKLYLFGGYGWSQIEHYSDLLNRQKDFQLAPDSRWPVFGWNNQLACFDPSRLAWHWPSYSGKCPSARAAHSGTLMGDKYFIFGGRDCERRLNDLYSLDLKTLEWTQIALISSECVEPTRQLISSSVDNSLEDAGDTDRHGAMLSNEQPRNNESRPVDRSADMQQSGDVIEARDMVDLSSSSSSSSSAALSRRRPLESEQIFDEMQETDGSDESGDDNNNNNMPELNRTLADDEEAAATATQTIGYVPSSSSAADEPHDQLHVDCGQSKCRHSEQTGCFCESSNGASTRWSLATTTTDQSNDSDQEPNEHVLFQDQDSEQHNSDVDVDDDDEIDDDADDMNQDVEHQREINLADEHNAANSRELDDAPQSGADDDDRRDDPDRLLPTGRSFCSFTPVTDDAILLFGGVSSQNENLDDCWLFDVSRNQWTQINLKYKCPRIWHTGSRSSFNEVILIGGSSSDRIDKYCCEILTLSTEPKTLKRLALDSVSRSIRMKQIAKSENLPSTLRKLIMLRKRAMAMAARRPSIQRPAAVQSTASE